MTLFPRKKYSTIYMDPPWPERGAGQCKRGADRHYQLMSVEEIMDLPIRSIASPASHIYIWVTNNFLEAGLACMRNWGFSYITTITWFKDTIGLGQYYRGKTEHCLFGVSALAPPFKILNGSRCQGVTGFYAPKQEHSVKPEEMRKMIEHVSYPEYIELFARRKVPGWDTWGNEL